MSVPGNHVFRIQNIMDLLPILLNDLKIIKVQIRANYYFENEEVLEQVSKSIKEIKNYLKNFEKTLDIDEKNLLKLVYGLKSLKFVDFEDLGNKYFYRFLEEEDGIYKGIIGFGQNDVLIKEGKGKKEYRDGRLYEGEWKNNKREGKGIEKYPDGAIYEGEFKTDLKEGKGIFKYPDGSYHKGQWKDNILLHIE